ncbi:MAG: methylated-DNA--[protein]-cysteine S-methyltransferase [Actinobacteria bacterium]|nr:methylated-DNA--[protein]-cysteine S-methyltransferase [Actinomycetota bacterium]
MAATIVTDHRLRATTAFTVVASPVGPLTLAGNPEALTTIWFDGTPPSVASGAAAEDPGPFRAAADQLEAYFAGDRHEFDLVLAPTGTDFQVSVWQALLEIPYGETRSYGQLAAHLGSPGASRAVGLANGRNPLAIVVPCHRVIGADGTLTGYAGGMDRKRLLLDLEAGVGSLL